MMPKNKTVTAAELMRSLSLDPEFREREAKRDFEQHRNVDRFHEITAPIVRDLSVKGVKVTSLDQLAHQYAPLSSEIVDVLLNWLPKITDRSVQESLIRMLGASAVRFNGTPLVEAFNNTEHQGLRWAIANTIAETRPKGIRDWLIRAVQDPAFGEARQMLCVAVARLTPQPVAKDLLTSLFDELPGFVAMALSEIGGERELALLCQRRKDYRGWVRKEIDKAVKAISRRIRSTGEPTTDWVS